MALEGGANVTSNVHVNEMPTSTETTIAMEVATSSNGLFTPNMNTTQTPKTMETPMVVDVSTSSSAETKITTNMHAMDSINTIETPIATELSTSSPVDTKMMIDGPSSVAMLKVMGDEREDSKECKSPSSMVTETFEQQDILGQSIVRVENYIQEENAGNSPLLQDDMFSLAELSVVENEQLDEATTVYCADIETSVSDHCYELGSGQLATTISGSGENCENDLQGVTEVTESIKSPMPINDTNGKENMEQVIAHAKVGDSTNGIIGDLENDYNCIDHIPNSGGACVRHDGQVKDHTNNIPNVSWASTHVVDHENKIENGHLLLPEVHDAANTTTVDKNERESMHGNQVTLSKSQPEVVMVKEINDTNSTQDERSVMKKEQGSFNEQEFERASIKEEEGFQQNLPERIQCVKQDDLEVEDKKSEEIEIPICGLAVSMNEGCVDMDIDHPSQGTSENLIQSKNMPEEIVSIKEEIVPQELSQNVLLLEKTFENSPKISSLNVNLEEANVESHTEHISQKDGDQLQESSEEFELLKGRKVYKKFGRKKFLGEVIGYDATTKWFKVLYEDGDEEEVEKNELDSILLPIDGKLVASRKRRLPTDDDDHEDANRTGSKSIKLSRQATPMDQGRRETTVDEVASKKRKPSAVKAGVKSKSLKVTGSKKRKPSAVKSQSTKSKRKATNRTKQSSSKKAIVVAENENESVTRKLKYGSAAKKTSTKGNQKSKEIPLKDKEEKTPQLPRKSVAAISGRKRKAGTDVQGTSTVSGKRTRREVVNDVESPPLRKMESKRRRIQEDSTEVHLEGNTENNHTNEDSITLPSEKRHIRSDKGSVLVGRKVMKDFGGSLYGGQIMGYKMYYNVKYDDGDNEDLTWKELESILLPEQGGSSQLEHEKQNTQNKVNPVMSKQKKKKQ